MSSIFPIAPNILFEFAFDCLVKIGKMTQNGKRGTYTLILHMLTTIKCSVFL